MKNLDTIEQECLNLIESVRTEMYHYGQSDNDMDMLKYQELKTSIEYMEKMVSIIQRQRK